MDVIITRYNEHLDWIRYLPVNIRNIYIYNKGTNDLLFKNFPPDHEYHKKIITIKMENVGRIDHTLAYHILNNWNNLPDVLINLPGSIMICARKGTYLSYICRNIDKLHTKFNGFYSPRFHRVSKNFNYSIDNYQAEGNCNKNNNTFIKSEYPDFKTWKEVVIDDRPMKCIAMRGMFMVSRENILKQDKKIYSNLLISLSVGDNIENGHFAERIWAHLFT
jgi:hypothetical protein